MVVEFCIQNIDATGCDFYYRLTTKASGAEVARAKTGIAFFDFTDRKVLRTHEKFKLLIGDQARRGILCDHSVTGPIFTT
jgi:hypothetical protein